MSIRSASNLAASAQIAGGGGGSAAGVSSNLWAPPETPHAYNDEFEASTLSGWTGVQNISDAAAGSFSYDTVDPYDTTFNSGNVVRVNVNAASRPSWAQIQLPATGKQFFIYKAITVPTNLLVIARMKFNMKLGGVNNDGDVSMALIEASGGVPTTNSRVELFLNEVDTATTQAQSHTISSTGTPSVSTHSTDVTSEGQALQYVAIHKVGTTFHCWVGTSDGNWIWLNSYSGLDFTPDMVAFGGINTSVANPGVAVTAVDFIRFFETDSFLL